MLQVRNGKISSIYKAPCIWPVHYSRPANGSFGPMFLREGYTNLCTIEVAAVHGRHGRRRVGWVREAHEANTHGVLDVC